MGMPVDIRNLPNQISGGTFQGYVEGWSWSTRFNELFLTINVSPVAFSQVLLRRYISDLRRSADDEFVTALKLSINFFEEEEEFEKCAF